MRLTLTINFQNPFPKSVREKKNCSKKQTPFCFKKKVENFILVFTTSVSFLIIVPFFAMGSYKNRKMGQKCLTITKKIKNFCMVTSQSQNHKKVPKLCSYFWLWDEPYCGLVGAPLVLGLWVSQHQGRTEKKVLPFLGHFLFFKILGFFVHMNSKICDFTNFLGSKTGILGIVSTKDVV